MRKRKLYQTILNRIKVMDIEFMAYNLFLVISYR